MFSPETPLIIHDGELADICQLLAELGLAYVEAPARVADVAAYYSAPLIISSPQYLLERLDDMEEKHPPRIAVMTSEARTLRSLLSRSGVKWMVRRPVHPTALRLFVLHCLYRGHNKRRNQRVSIGTEVQLKHRWRRRKLLLAEISERDCRLVTPLSSYKIDQRVSLRLPRSVTGETPLTLAGRVVRIGTASKTDGLRDVCLIFEHPGSQDAALLAKVLERHSKGPAIFGGQLAAPQAGELEPPSASPATVEDNQADGSPNLSEEESGANRRAMPRHSFERRVIALGDEAAKVLLGRDISCYGMRVDPSSALALGDKLQIAIHTPGQATPLVLKALVDRDDGERGLLLHFTDVPADAKAILQQMIEPLPELAEPSNADEDESSASAESRESSNQPASSNPAEPGDSEDSNLIVSEILDHSPGEI